MPVDTAAAPDLNCPGSSGARPCTLPDMPTLQVEGPYEVNFWLNDRGTKHIEAEQGREFFEEWEGLAECRGCYIFAIRSGRGIRGAYVGKATKGFAQEVFAVDKLQKYNTALHRWDHGSPVLIFVVMPAGTRSGKVIREVEEYLIRSVKRAWPDILNKHHTGADDWEIAGVTADQPGRQSSSVVALAQLLRFGK